MITKEVSKNSSTVADNIPEAGTEHPETKTTEAVSKPASLPKRPRGGKNSAPVRDEEATFHFEDMFFSSTDLKGVITDCNSVFRRIAEYGEEELMGKAHNIIRHPWMPRAVFKLLWDYLHAGKDVLAYVVNRTRSGKYYWVLALVSPVTDISGTVTEYISVRIKPSSPILDKVKELYNAMLAAEETGGMEAGETCLVEALEGLGFASYDEFMSVALREEMAHYLKNDILTRTVGSGSGQTDKTAARLIHTFDKVVIGQGISITKFEEVFEAFKTLDTLFQSTRFFFDSVKDSSMNIAISSSKLDGTASAALSPIAFELINLSSSASATVQDFQSIMSGIKTASDRLDLNLRWSMIYSTLVKFQLSEDRSGQGDGNRRFLKSASNITAKSLVEIDSGLRELRSARGELQDFIGRKLGSFLASGSSLCIQGMIQAGIWKADHMVNTMTELQELTGKVETEIDEASRLFVQIDEVLDYITRVVFQVQSGSEKLEEVR